VSAARSPTCSPPSPPPARPQQRSKRSPPKRCCSRPGTCLGRTPANCTGRACATTTCCSWRTTPATPAPTATAGAARSPTPPAYHRTLTKARQDWTTLIPDAHPGYISWDQFETNQATLTANAAAHGEDRNAGPAREGPALLQGLVICGKCGRRMSVNYHRHCTGTLVPDYTCQREGIATGTPPCQSTSGAGIDAAVTELVLASLTPLAVQTALAVSTELAARAAEADRIRATSVQRAQHAADAARRRYLAVDPSNRLVADTLEADWNHKLRELADAQDDYERASSRDAATLSDQQQQRIRALTEDLPALWHDPATPMRERKRLIRLLVTDVTLIRSSEHITAHVRLPGGQQHTLTVPRPRTAAELHTTPAATLALIDELMAQHTFDEAITVLHERNILTGWGKPYEAPRIPRITNPLRWVSGGNGKYVEEAQELYSRV
jgi:hypothetical protein